MAQKKLPITGRVGNEDVTFVDKTPEEMVEEIVRLNQVLFEAKRHLSLLSNSRHPSLEAARFSLTHGGTHRKRNDRGGWNTPKKKRT